MWQNSYICLWKLCHARKLVRFHVKISLVWNVANFIKIDCYSLLLFRRSHWRCSLKIGVLKNFAKFTGKHLYQSLFFSKVPSLKHAILLRKKPYRTPPGDCFWLFTIWWIILISLLVGCYHQLVFMDPVNGYLKSKLLAIYFSLFCLYIYIWHWYKKHSQLVYIYNIYMYIYIYIYIYIKHIHWLNLTKGWSKRPDFIKKLLTSLIMSSFKEIGLFDE